MSGFSFELSEEQKILQESVRKFVQKEIIPIAGKCDESGELPLDLIAKVTDLGFANLSIPAEYGGVELDNLSANIVIEELAYGCAGITTSCIANDLALGPINIAGTSEQKKEFIKPIVEGKKLASFCLSEPGAGSDAGGLSSKVKKVEGGYLLTGKKQWITNGGLASQYTVFATLDPSLRHKGICCFVVPANQKGVQAGHHENKMGQRASNTTSVDFDGVFIPESARIGAEGEGFKIAMQTLDFSRPFTAIISVGIARRALESALSYSRDRKQFGQSISEFQAVQFMLADAATEIEAARMLSYKSSWLIDQGKKSSLSSAMAKRFAADIAMKITTDAVQIYGGYGYTKDYPVEKLMRDAKLMQIYEGTSQIQRIVIAREILNK
jgi:acyl-CoA dehydrogenase